MNALRHPDIVEVFGFGTLPDGRRYHLMDLLDRGALLDRLLAEQTRLPLAQTLAILRGVARALAAAHARGVAHGDLKPANVFVDSRDGSVPKLLDFGLAALRGEPGQPTLAGSPHYMSPEQCRGEPPSAASDVYAFGVLSYRLLAGVLPFEGEDWLDVLVRHTSEEPVPPSRRDSCCPPRWTTPCSGCSTSVPRVARPAPRPRSTRSSTRSSPASRHVGAAWCWLRSRSRSSPPPVSRLPCSRRVHAHPAPRLSPHAKGHLRPRRRNHARDRCSSGRRARITMGDAGKDRGAWSRRRRPRRRARPIQLDRGQGPVRLELSRRGWAPAVQEVVPEGDTVLVVPMHRLGRTSHD